MLRGVCLFQRYRLRLVYTWQVSVRDLILILVGPRLQERPLLLLLLLILLPTLLQLLLLLVHNIVLFLPLLFLLLRRLLQPGRRESLNLQPSTLNPNKPYAYCRARRTHAGSPSSCCRRQPCFEGCYRV